MIMSATSATHHGASKNASATQPTAVAAASFIRFAAISRSASENATASRASVAAPTASCGRVSAARNGRQSQTSPNMAGITPNERIATLPHSLSTFGSDGSELRPERDRGDEG